MDAYEPDPESDSPLMTAAYLALSAITAAILVALAVLVALPAMRTDPGLAVLARSVAPSHAQMRHVSRQGTVVYLVSSREDGDHLEAALSEWRLEIEALGVADREPRRFVVVQTPDDVLHQRYIDFTALATQAPNLDLQVIDLRD